MKHISSDTCLEPGTRVRVGNFRGQVSKSEMLNASNGGMVAINTVQFTEKFKRGFGVKGTWVPITHTKHLAINYASIILEE